LKIRLARVLPSILSIIEIENILKLLYREKNQCLINSYRYNVLIRNIAVIELLFASGIRVSELCELKKENIELNYSYIKILGKGQKERIIPITNLNTREALQEYYNAYKYLIDNKDLFFINRCAF